MTFTGQSCMILGGKVTRMPITLDLPRKIEEGLIVKLDISVAIFFTCHSLEDFWNVNGLCAALSSYIVTVV